MAQRSRTLFFWLHLTTGLVIGLIVLVMSVTGALLAFEKQLAWRADTADLQVAGDASTPRLSIDELLARVRATGLVAEPSAIAVRRDPAAPVALTAGAGTVAYADPYTGRLLGGGNTAVRAFFRGVTDWHRWLAASADLRSTGRAVTGAANLAFLFLVLSGAYLWIPRTWVWRQLRQIVWFRRGLPGKARDFNWHNTIGVWSALPLALIVASGVVISYPWASNLVYLAAGEAPPAPPQRAERGPRREGPGEGERREGQAREGQRREGASREGERERRASPALDAAWHAAEAQRAGWRTITLRVPASDRAPLAFTIDEGGPGQPQYRGTLTVDRATGAATWEGFDQLSRGRRLRSLLRFAHTGEVLGAAGQAVAGLVSLGAAVLVYTGVALSLRRFLAWRGRSRDALAAARPAARFVSLCPRPTHRFDS
jgi:uncharacterized iron-regulated membrane protein